MRVLFLLLGLVVLVTAPAPAADWGQIKPGTSTQAEVRSRYGAPTRETSQKVEGYDTLQWLYEGPQAPVGMKKMTVDFGLLTPSGYRKDVVRTFRLEPKHDVFNRKLVLDGWGLPPRAGKEGELEFFLYAEGLLVYFGQDENEVLAMIFTLPQKLPPASATPPQR
jgi:hypothetical protein